MFLGSCRYIPGTTDLIFQKKKKKPDSASLVIESSQRNNEEIPFNLLPVSSNVQQTCTTASPGICINVGAVSTHDTAFKLDTYCKIKSPILCDNPDLGETQTAGPSFILSSQATIDNTIQEQEPLLYLVPSSEEETLVSCSALTSEDLLQPYYSENEGLQDNGIEDNIPPDEAFCTSTVGSTEDTEEIHCTDTFIDLLANKKKEAVLRGDPSLYPQASLDKVRHFLCYLRTFT